jgi:hypothetical protein
MKLMIRAALLVISLTFGIHPVANAATANSNPATIQQDSMASWANG